MAKKIALIYGGDSSEWGISVLSGKFVASCLDPKRYAVTELLLRNGQWNVCDPAEKEVAVPVKPFIPSELKNFDVAMIMIHGTPGENGILQAELERHGVPFTTCSSRVSAITFDKHACKKAMQGLGIPLAPEVFLHRGEPFNAEEVVEKLGLPVFVKPNDGGSSFGVTKVKRQEDLAPAIAAAFSESDDVLIESFIPGRELTEGVFNRHGDGDHSAQRVFRLRGEVSGQERRGVPGADYRRAGASGAGADTPHLPAFRLPRPDPLRLHHDRVRQGLLPGDQPDPRYDEDVAGPRPDPRRRPCRPRRP